MWSLTPTSKQWIAIFLDLKKVFNNYFIVCTFRSKCLSYMQSKLGKVMSSTKITDVIAGGDQP